MIPCWMTGGATRCGALALSFATDKIPKVRALAQLRKGPIPELGAAEDHGSL